MDLLLLVKVLWRKIWIIIAIPLIAAFAAYLFTMNTVETYKAVSQIATGFTTNDQVLLTDEKFNLRDADVRFNNLMNMLNSGITRNLLSYRLLLHDLNPVEVPFRRPDPQLYTLSKEEKEKVRGIVQQKLDSLKPLVASDKDYPLIRKYFYAYGYTYDEVSADLGISRIPNTDYIQVDYSSDKPALSALAANAFTEEFIRYNRSLKTSRGGESVDLLKQVVDQKKAELDNKLEIQRSFKSSNNILDPQGESGAKISQLTELETQRDLYRSNVHRWELTLQRLTEDIRTASAPVTNGGNQRILDLKARIDRLNDKYVTGGFKDQKLADSLTILRDQLRVQIDNSQRAGANLGTGVTIGDLQAERKEAQINLQVEKENLVLIENKIRSVEYNLSGYASKEARLEALSKEVELASEEYQAATEKYNEAKNRMADSNTSLRQVLVAVPPGSPENSKRIIIIGLAGVVSAALCLFVIVALELIDGSVRTPEKFKRLVGLPLAGSLNRIDSRNFNIRSYFNQQNGNEETEMFKSLLRKVRHEIESLNAKVILFTSPKRKDGKTFLMFSLSYVLSLVNKRVLIIDTNFKNNSLSQILGRNQSDLKVLDSKKHRLLTAAQGGHVRGEGEQAEFDRENSYDLINPTKYKNIYIVGNAGGGTESPAEILSGRDFSNLITALSDSFDYILMEGAALNDYSDTKELVKYADKVVAVFSAESSVKQLDRETIYYLKSLGKKFGGAVLNRVDTKDLKL
jgi:polysaccharide biosynthesis transport protein